MKRCSECEETKPLSEFHIRVASRNGLRPTCKDCHNRKARLYAQRKDVKVRRAFLAKQRIPVQQKQNRQRAIEMFNDKCLDCDQRFPYNMYDFHHLEPDMKKYGISDLMRTKWSERLDKELAKCVMLCPNCHRGRHPEYGN